MTYDEFYRAVKGYSKTAHKDFMIVSRYIDTLNVEMWRIECNVMGAKIESLNKAENATLDWIIDTVSEIRKTIETLTEDSQKRRDIQWEDHQKRVIAHKNM